MGGSVRGRVCSWDVIELKLMHSGSIGLGLTFIVDWHI